MKKNAILIVIMAFLGAGFIYGCYKDKNSSSIKISVQSDIDKALQKIGIAYRDSGWAYVKRDSDKIVIYQKSKGLPQGTFNKIIALTLDNINLNFVKTDLPNDSLYLWYSKTKRQIITYSYKTNKILVLALNDTGGISLVNKLKSLKFNDATMEYALGYGLSVVNKQFQVQDFLQRNLAGQIIYKTPTYISTLDDPTPINPVLNSPTCNSGGVGSSQCSVTNSTFSGGAGCSVTCNSGYYACCDDDKVVCKCYANPKK